jgi:23S rRNA pseudouridine2605 synthase
VYIMLNKPAGYACTRRDPHLPSTVYHLLPRGMNRLFTVGRLDVDTEGLLLLTNDGTWANDIAHPRKHVSKTYLAEVSGVPVPADLDQLRRGIELEDGLTLPARARLVWQRPSQERARLQIVITEGRKRQVRRMLAAVGLPVVWLQRTSIGPVELGALPLGRWRELSPDEIEALRREAGA